MDTLVGMAENWGRRKTEGVDGCGGGDGEPDTDDDSNVDDIGGDGDGCSLMVVDGGRWWLMVGGEGGQGRVASDTISILRGVITKSYSVGGLFYLPDFLNWG